MRHHPIAAFVAVLFLISPSAGEVSAQSTDPSVPTGTLSVNSSVVQAGTSPTLTWGVTYPSIVTDLVTVTPSGTITPKRSLEMKVTVIGCMAIRRGTTGPRLLLSPTEALLANGPGSFTSIFYDTDNHWPLLPTVEVYKNLPIRFGGRLKAFHLSTVWGPMYISGDPNGRVRALVNGDENPTKKPLGQIGGIDFLTPYLDADGKIKIGPKDVIVVFELSHSNPQDDGFDLQDLVLLCTFTEI
jgi:hypothetical protein